MNGLRFHRRTPLSRTRQDPILAVDANNPAAEPEVGMRKLSKTVDNPGRRNVSSMPHRGKPEAAAEVLR
jgi:hypothetical protein